MKKSERHSKITGDFGEHLVLYFLSKHNYEVAHIDYTGIDILAHDKTKNEKIGISIKSRSRTIERPSDGLLIQAGNYKKIISSCKTFNCKPWVCILIDKPAGKKGKIFLYLLSLNNLCKYYPAFKEGKAITFSMSHEKIVLYNNDRNIYKMEFEYNFSNWTNA